VNQRLRALWYVLGALIPVLWLATHWSAPLVEDALFWFVPTAIEESRSGLVLAVEGPLPEAVTVAGAPMPHQWKDGLPDTAHPPLWFWWMALFLKAGITLNAIRAACVLPAALAGLGFVALAEANGRAWAGLTVWAIPSVLAQLLRPELDLPLLACIPWALVALRWNTWTAFAAIAVVATWCKEPGVLLVVPALVEGARRRNLPVQALAPLAAIAAWSLLHGGLAAATQTPTSPSQFGANLLGIVQFVVFDQGRVLLLLGGAGLLAAPVEASLIATFCLFFASVRYDATAGTEDAFTHLRYLSPAVAIYVVVTAARLDYPVAIVQLYWLHRMHAHGPEGSMAGVDSAYADRAALQSVRPGEVAWAGSYTAAGVGRAWTGYPATPGLKAYDFHTTPAQLATGDLLIASTYGEPSRRLERGLKLQVVSTWSVGDAQTRVLRVLGQDPRGWVPAAVAPR
jgi:hypothetical protein